MRAAWLERGPDVINRLIAERPEIFLMAMLKITQVNRIELGRPEDFDRPSSKEEALLGVRRSLVFAQARIDLDQIATEKKRQLDYRKRFVVCRYRH